MIFCKPEKLYPILDPFDPLSQLFLGRPTCPDDLKSAVEEFFFPRALGKDTWINLREKVYPSFLDLICDLIPDRQRIIFINEWIYHTCFTAHTDALDGSIEVTEDTFGLKDIFITILSEIYTRARDNGGLINSDWIYILLQQHLPQLVQELSRKFPSGDTFQTRYVNYTRVSSNLEYLEVGHIIYVLYLRHITYYFKLNLF